MALLRPSTAETEAEDGWGTEGYLMSQILIGCFIEGSIAVMAMAITYNWLFLLGLYILQMGLYDVIGTYNW